MAIDFTCGSCGTRLRVPDENAGKQARCSNCQTVVSIPAAGQAAQTPATFAPIKTTDQPAANPYGTPAAQFPNPAAHHPVPRMSDGTLRADSVAPLQAAAGWMQLAGWFAIVIGGIYCLTIIGLIVGWLPLWVGFCLKNAGDSLKAGINDPNVYKASKNLGTVATIAGVLTIIYIALITLYIVGIIVFLLVGASQF